MFLEKLTIRFRKTLAEEKVKSTQLQGHLQKMRREIDEQKDLMQNALYLKMKLQEAVSAQKTTGTIKPEGPNTDSVNDAVSLEALRKSEFRIGELKQANVDLEDRLRTQQLQIINLDSQIKDLTEEVKSLHIRLASAPASAAAAVVVVDAPVVSLPHEAALAVTPPVDVPPVIPPADVPPGTPPVDVPPDAPPVDVPPIAPPVDGPPAAPVIDGVPDVPDVPVDAAVPIEEEVHKRRTVPKDFEPTVPMKKLQWGQPVENFEQTVWEEFKELEPDLVEKEEFSNLFCKLENKPKPTAKPKAEAESKSKKPVEHEIRLINPTKARNVDIALSRLKMGADKIREKLLEMGKRVHDLQCMAVSHCSRRNVFHQGGLGYFV